MLGSHQKTITVGPRSCPPRTLTATLKRKADVSPHSNVSKKSRGGRKSSEKKRSGNKSGPRYSTSKIRRFGKVRPKDIVNEINLWWLVFLKRVLSNITSAYHGARQLFFNAPTFLLFFSLYLT